jgi:NadR type nicotinamide-nucleotide adenylyltransferase
VKPEIFRVTLIGPESSGKTSLCSALAHHYSTSWVPEFAREYIGSLKRPYTREDILYCAKKQIETEFEISKSANKILFSDTELINCHVWLLDGFNKSEDWIEKKISENPYNLFLLTKADIPFVADDVRENPFRREYFYEWYLRELEERKFVFEIIEGIGEDRLLNAVHAIEKHWSSR